MLQQKKRTAVAIGRRRAAAAAVGGGRVGESLLQQCQKAAGHADGASGPERRRWPALVIACGGQSSGPAQCSGVSSSIRVWCHVTAWAEGAPAGTAMGGLLSLGGSRRLLLLAAKCLWAG